ncbi:TetR/AcrR family transcriptional regulator [Microlunatus flavus]|uniref:Regulatory protein, tetR family n=1 Tax=Microlunatus flavus TaxID=1036181 RepID=A0A1H9JFS6_9ACTN|nr:TetR/AcrR family transcriptional regulator [Microlunatus flavus]SEQ85841.1 regulatory protein, tetR family [Microlunatus flavus]
MDEQPRAPRRLRADAAQNADRLLAAAVRAGLGEGKHVPLEQIAAEAGVGIGTLYRRFPSRAALLEALEVRAYGLLIAEAEGALRDGPTGLEAIGHYLRRTFEHRDELVLPLHGAPLTEGSESGALRGRLKGLMSAMVDRGHEDGSVRPEVSAWTVVRFGSMLAQPMTDVEGWAESAEDQRVVFLRGIAGDAQR